MKHHLSLIIPACCISAAHADESINPVAPAASAPASAASDIIASSVVTATIQPSVNVEAVPIEGIHEGQVLSISGCGETNHAAVKTFVVARTVVSGLGAWFLNFVPAPKVRFDKKCVVVSFPDGTADQLATFQSKDFDPKIISLNQAVSVRFEGGKPIFPWASAQ